MFFKYKLNSKDNLNINFNNLLQKITEFLKAEKKLDINMCIIFEKT